MSELICAVCGNSESVHSPLSSACPGFTPGFTLGATPTPPSPEPPREREGETEALLTAVERQLVRLEREEWWEREARRLLAALTHESTDVIERVTTLAIKMRNGDEQPAASLPPSAGGASAQHREDRIMDYRALLGKYMSLVGWEEGVDFIDVNNPTPPTFSRGPQITQEEWDELRAVSAEGKAEEAAYWGWKE